MLYHMQGKGEALVSSRGTRRLSSPPLLLEACDSRPENNSDRTIGDVLCYFRGWQVHVETLLDCGVTKYNAPPLLYM
jgi:hypothetical protein